MSDKKKIFLGGTCGTTTWRGDIAIPALEKAGVTYFNPQLPAGAWTPECEAAELKAKAEAKVLLFVVDGATRGIASMVEVAHFLGLGRKIALFVEDVAEAAVLGDETISKEERKDLNRGRLFLRTVAKEHDVPVSATIAEAVQRAIALSGKR